MASSPRYGLAAMACLAACGPAWPADLDSVRAHAGPLLFAPTNPVGVASEFPRSPLADLAVNGFVRFDTAAEARAHCPHDAIVWVSFDSNHYHPAGGRRTENGSGAFMCQADASAEGDRP
jgi:hypothetical protein